MDLGLFSHGEGDSGRMLGAIVLGIYGNFLTNTCVPKCCVEVELVLVEHVVDN